MEYIKKLNPLSHNDMPSNVEDFAYKKNVSFEERKSEASRIMAKYPDRIPIIVEKTECADIPDIDKKKYLVPCDITLGQFQYVIRKKISLRDDQAIFLLINNTLQPTSSLISQLYNDHREDCGYLFIKYTSENTFGTSIL